MMSRESGTDEENRESEKYVRGLLTPIAGGFGGLMLGSIVGGGVGAAWGGLIGCVSAFLILCFLVKDRDAQPGESLRGLETVQGNAGEGVGKSNKLVRFLIRLFSARSDR